MFYRKIKYFIIIRLFHIAQQYFIRLYWSDYVKENKLVELSTDFAVKIIKLCQSIKGNYSLTNQLERSATSIGANIREANYARSKADFVAKLKISLQECNETEYWLELIIKSELASEDIIKPLINQCGTIRRILIASVNTVLQNK